jgi:HNH endonuclease
MTLTQGRPAGQSLPGEAQDGVSPTTETAADRACESSAKGSARLVLWAVATLAGWREAELPACAILSLPKLARMTALTERSAKEGIRRLLEAGQIQVTGTPDGGRAELAFVIPHGPELAPAKVATTPPIGSGSTVGAGLTRMVFDRDGWECVSCGGHRYLSVDHVIPRSRGGTDDLENLQTMCIPCNIRKGART